MNEDIKNAIDIVKKDTSEIVENILKENDVDELKKQIDLFNIAQAKKNVIRVLKLDDLYDSVSDNIAKRFDEIPGAFSNEELVKYLTAIDNGIEKASKKLSTIDIKPIIQYNEQNNVNINVGSELSRESRQNVIDAINAILKGDSPIDGDGTID